MADTPGAFPIISDSTTVRFKAGALVALLGGVVGFVFWLTTMHNTISHNSGRLERIEADVREIKNDIKGIRSLGYLP